jgi:hypothetical protein
MVASARCRLALAGIAIAIAIAGTACGGADSVSVASTPTSDAQAVDMCRAALPGGSFVDAYVTTVAEVRDRRGGPSPGYSPADAEWAALDGGEPAAWCAGELDGTYSIWAVGPDDRTVKFTSSSEPLAVGPEGPEIP